MRRHGGLNRIGLCAHEHRELLSIGLGHASSVPPDGEAASSVRIVAFFITWSGRPRIESTILATALTLTPRKSRSVCQSSNHKTSSCAAVGCVPVSSFRTGPSIAPTR